jgi:hypothetical protein
MFQKFIFFANLTKTIRDALGDEFDTIWKESSTRDVTEVTRSLVDVNVNSP